MLAVFDSDHTLFRSNLSYAFGRFLYQNKNLSFINAFSCCCLYLLHKCFLIDSVTLHKKIFSLIFQNRRKENFQRLVANFFDLEWDRLLVWKIYEILRSKQQQGCEVFILSNSPQFLLDEVGKRLQLDKVIGTEYLERCGVFQSLGSVMDGEQKKKIVLDYAKSKRCEMANISVYTDSIADYPLLQIVGKPISVNPDFWLRCVCRKKNWEILQMH